MSFVFVSLFDLFDTSLKLHLRFLDRDGFNSKIVKTGALVVKPRSQIIKTKKQHKIFINPFLFSRDAMFENDIHKNIPNLLKN